MNMSQIDKSSLWIERTSLKTCFKTLSFSRKNMRLKNFFEFFQFLWSPQSFCGVPKNWKMGVPSEPVGVPKNWKMGVPNEPVGVPKNRKMGVPSKSLGVPPQKKKNVESQVGVPPKKKHVSRLAKRGGGGYPQALSEVVTLRNTRDFVGFPIIPRILHTDLRNREGFKKRTQKSKCLTVTQLSALDAWHVYVWRIRLRVHRPTQRPQWHWL